MENGKTVRQWIKMNVLPLSFISAILMNSLIVFLLIDERSLWLDESITWFYSKRNYQDIIIQLKSNNHPPLYFFAAKWWTTHFGTSETALRFPSYLFGLGVIYAVYNLCKTYFDRQTTMISLILVSLNPYLIYYQTEARMYTLLTMFVLFYLNSVLNILQNRKVRQSWIIGAISATGAFYSQYFGLFGVAAVSGFALIYTLLKKLHQSTSLLISMNFVSAIAFYPWMSVVQNQSKTGGGASKEVDLYQGYLFLFQSFSYGHLFDKAHILNFVIFSLFLLFSVACIVITNYKLLAGTNLRKSLSETDTAVFLYLELIYLANYLVPTTISYLKFPLGYSIYNIRYFIFSLILAKIIAAYSLSYVIRNFAFHTNTAQVKFQFLKTIHIRKKIHMEGVVMMLLLILLLNQNLSFPPESREYRDASQFLMEKNSSYLPILVDPFYDAVVFEYYLNETWNTYLEGVQFGPDTIDIIITRLDNQTELWYVMGLSSSRYSLVYNSFLDQGYVNSSYGLVEFFKVIMFKLGPKE